MQIPKRLIKLVRLVALAINFYGFVEPSPSISPVDPAMSHGLAARMSPFEFESLPTKAIGSFQNILLTKEKLASRNITRGEMEESLSKLGAAISPELANKLTKIIVDATVGSDAKLSSNGSEILQTRQAELAPIISPAWMAWIAGETFVTGAAALISAVPLLAGIAVLLLAGIIIPIVLAAEGKIGGGHKEIGVKTVVALTIGSWGTNAPAVDGNWSVPVIDMNQQGSVPHLQIWNEQGKHLGILSADKKGHLNAGITKIFQIPHGESAEAQRTTATYLSVYMNEFDAICISQIRASTDNGLMYSWLGDIGYVCGHEWYYNDMTANVFGYLPKCTWLDSDGNKRNQGMGIHLPDFVATPQRVLQYHLDPRLLCNSPGRFAMYKKFSDDHKLPIFDPPLEYNEDTTDKDPNKVLDGAKYYHSGGPPLQYENATARIQPLGSNFGMPPGVKPEEGAANATKHGDLRRRTPYKLGHEVKLISSDYESHDIHELCDHEANARGPDFVSIRQNLFCDMGAKELWPLCDDKNHHECFDYETKNMRLSRNGAQKRDARDREIPVKQYVHEFVWRDGEDSLAVTI